jgi:hypothetical protein
VLTIVVVAELLAGDAALGRLSAACGRLRGGGGLVVARQSGWEYGGQYFAG